jgi:enoyl-CoA hydratase/carnithine racemase
LNYQDIRFQLEDGIGFVTLNRPEKRNALSLNLMAEMIGLLQDVRKNEEFRVLIIRAAGPVFSSGHDLAEMKEGTVVSYRGVFEACTEMMEAIRNLPQPVIAQVQGMATAAGCQLVATCDLAVAAKSAGFAIPGGKGGLFCHTPLVAVARNVGRKRALEMALTGDAIDADTAVDWGLINAAVPDEELHAATQDLLARATRGSVASKALGKRGFYAQVGMEQSQAYEYAKEMMALNALAEDAREGISAFLEKRPPEWKGK